MSTTHPIEEDLDQFLVDAERPPDYYEEPEDLAGLAGPWKIADDGAADWCLRNLALALAEQEKVKAAMRDRLRHLSEWESGRLKRPKADEAHWRALLEEYAVRRRAITKAASVSLPNGKISTVRSGEAVEIASEQELLVFLALHPAMRESWCKMEPEPQISRFEKEVRVVDGAACRTCGLTIVPTRGGGIWTGGIWISTHGMTCLTAPAAFDGDKPVHKPVTDEAGEVQIRRAVVLPATEKDWPVLVPGLAVRAEKITPHARPGS